VVNAVRGLGIPQGAGGAPMSYHATRAEQETVIRWDREDDMVHLWSASPITWRKLKRLGITPTRETRYRNTPDVSGRFYVVPLSLFRWGLKRPRSGRLGDPGFGARIARSRQDARIPASASPSEASPPSRGQVPPLGAPPARKYPRGRVDGGLARWRPSRSTTSHE
jgi:hypothetical protein